MGDEDDTDVGGYGDYVMTWTADDFDLHYS
jgi:hypothetical protein